MSAFQEYEFEIKEKKNIFTRLFEKLFGKKNTLLLYPGRDEILRKNSTDLMWRVTGFKQNIFDEFDVLKKKRRVIEDEKEKVLFQVIGKQELEGEFTIANKKIEKLIIPRNVAFDKNKN